MNERNAYLPAFATDDLHRLAKLNGGDIEKAWADSDLCGEHHLPNKDLMVARVSRWLGAING